MHIFRCIYINLLKTITCLHDSIVVSIPACHAGDRGSIPRRGAFFILEFYALPSANCRVTNVAPLTISILDGWTNSVNFSEISCWVREAHTVDRQHFDERAGIHWRWLVMQGPAARVKDFRVFISPSLIKSDVLDFSMHRKDSEVRIETLWFVQWTRPWTTSRLDGPALPGRDKLTLLSLTIRVTTHLIMSNWDE